MKTTKTTKAIAGRRGFLLGAGAASAAGAAVIATKGTLPAAPEAPAPQMHAKGGGGYHVTEHVRHYYKTTMI
jgi:hypothetical protein